MDNYAKREERITSSVLSVGAYSSHTVTVGFPCQDRCQTTTALS